MANGGELEPEAGGVTAGICVLLNREERQNGAHCRQNVEKCWTGSGGREMVRIHGCDGTRWGRERVSGKA